MSLSYKTLFTLCLSTTCPSLQVWGDPAKPSLRQEQHCLRRLWHEHCQCCVRQNTCFLQLHCKRTTQAQHNGCTISSLLSPRTKSWGSWAVSILHLSATCHLSCLTRAEQPHLRNKLWGQLRNPRQLLQGVLQLRHAVGVFAVRGNWGSESSHWGCSVLVLNACPCSCNTGLGYVIY